MAFLIASSSRAEQFAAEIRALAPDLDLRVAPGEIANVAPALAAWFRSVGDITVPAPTQISGTSAAMDSMARSA